MRIGILETGLPPAHLVSAHGRYDAMTRKLLGDGHVYRTYRVFEGELPADPTECDAYVITGSSAGVYDSLPWIAALIDFLQRTRGRARLVGICFGHQVMAQAFGGEVQKAAQGWGLGLHRYDVVDRAAWMDDVPSFTVPASHQDQVVALPPHSHVVATSDFTPFAMLAYDDQPAISFQCHPEFDTDFAEALIDLRADRIDDQRREDALESLALPNDGPRLGRWINRFLAEGA